MDGGAGVTVTGAAGGAVVVERSGACLSIRSAAAPTGRLAASLPPEPGWTAVAVDGSAAPALYALDGRLLADLHQHLPRPPGGRPARLPLLLRGAAPPGPGG